MGDGGWHWSRGAVLRHGVFARQRDLLRPVRHHAEQPAPLAAAGRLTVLPIRGDTEATDTAGVIRRFDAYRHTTHEVFALVARPAAEIGRASCREECRERWSQDADEEEHEARKSRNISR